MSADAAGQTSTARHLFVYGSLTDPRTVDRVLGHVHRGERLRARLAGYERAQHPSYGYPFLVPHDRAHVEGVLLMDLSEADLVTLDTYEEVDQGFYMRTGVEVEVFGCGARGAHMQVETYIGGSVLRNLLAAATVLATDRA
jgi:gamma-glutamylcyclotransferase (GGCT)/AIG2-like uncharacterized protein YtfP